MSEQGSALTPTGQAQMAARRSGATKVMGFAGCSGAGKTTLIEQLIALFCQMGLRVSVIKHAHHHFDVDRPEKDSFRHRSAGATEVMLVSSERWALMHELNGEEEPSLDAQIARMSSCDLLLVEGFKATSIPKIEVHRVCLDRLHFRSGMNIVAVASDGNSHAEDSEAITQLDINDPGAVARFILDYLEIHTDPSKLPYTLAKRPAKAAEGCAIGAHPFASDPSGSSLPDVTLTTS